MDEPVYFYVQGASSALELVVNKLGKESIAGYISTPKGFFPNATNVLAARPEREPSRTRVGLRQPALIPSQARGLAGARRERRQNRRAHRRHSSLSERSRCALILSPAIRPRAEQTPHPRGTPVAYCRPTPSLLE